MLLLKDIIQDIWIVDWKISWIDTFITQLISIWLEFVSKEEWQNLSEIVFEINWEDIRFRFKLIWKLYLQKIMIKHIDWEEIKVDFSDIYQFKQ